MESLTSGLNNAIKPKNGDEIMNDIQKIKNEIHRFVNYRDVPFSHPGSLLSEVEK